MFHLGNAHCGLSSIGLYQLVWIIQRPSHFDNDLHTSLFRQLHDLLVSFSRISVRVFLED